MYYYKMTFNFSVTEIRKFYIEVLQEKIKAIRKANKNDLWNEVCSTEDLKNGFIEWMTSGEPVENVVKEEIKEVVEKVKKTRTPRVKAPKE